MGEAAATAPGASTAAAAAAAASAGEGYGSTAVGLLLTPGYVPPALPGPEDPEE